mgnify:CR=1 FL=1
MIHRYLHLMCQQLKEKLWYHRSVNAKFPIRGLKIVILVAMQQTGLFRITEGAAFMS